jgi:putative tricarboxylic transport membrane protein
MGARRTIQSVVTAGPGGASDQLARTIQAIVAKHGLIDRPITVVNKPGANSA